jgi:hypothetical protein
MCIFKGSHTVNFFNIHKHLLNSVVVLVELLVNSHPVRILHVYQPVVLGASYGVFTCIYFLCGGTGRDLSTKIYPTLDWQHPHMGVITTVGACALLVVLHTLLWLLYVARVRVARAFFGERPKPLDDNTLSLK